jgi:hypothetical protein
MHSNYRQSTVHTLLLVSPLRFLAEAGEAGEVEAEGQEGELGAEAEAEDHHRHHRDLAVKLL